jgi:hypothetical protein
MMHCPLVQERLLPSYTDKMHTTASGLQPAANPPRKTASLRCRLLR